MITDEANQQEYGASGGTPEGAYLVPFRFDDPLWLIVTVHADAADQTGSPLSYQSTPPEPAEGSATFTLTTDTSGAGGTLQHHVKPTVALVAPQWLRITRFTPAKQTLSLTPNAPLPTRQLENALDRLTMALQDRDAKNGTGFDNALLFPADEPAGHATELPPASQRAGTLLGFDGQTGAIAMKTIEALADGLIDDKVEELEAEAAVLQAAAEAAINTYFNESFDTYFYRHSNGGLKFGNTTITDGSGTFAPGMNSLTIQPAGDAANRAGGSYAIALGYQTSADGSYAVSIGSSTMASAANSIALGTATVVTGPPGGGSPSLGGVSAIAIGPSAQAQIPSSVVIGHNAMSVGVGSELGGVALGFNSKVTGSYNTAIGHQAEADGQSAVAIGHQAVTGAAQQVAIGYQSGSAGGGTALGAVSVGVNCHANAEKATALGQTCTAGGKWSSATGHGNTATAEAACAFGTSNTASGQRSSAFGYRNKVLGQNASAYGYNNEVGTGALRSTAIGCGVVLTVPDCADFRAAADGPRVFLSGPAQSVHLSYKLTDTAPTVSAHAWGYETGANIVPRDMLTFRVNAAKTQLYIHLAVPNGSGGYLLKTATLALTP